MAPSASRNWLEACVILFVLTTAKLLTSIITQVTLLINVARYLSYIMEVNSLTVVSTKRITHASSQLRT